MVGNRPDLTGFESMGWDTNGTERLLLRNDFISGADGMGMDMKRVEWIGSETNGLITISHGEDARGKQWI